MLQGSLCVNHSRLWFLGATANVLLSVVLIQFYGLVGVALGTLVSTLVIRTFTIPILIGTQLNVSVWDYIRQTAFRPVLIAALLTFAMFRYAAWGIRWFRRTN